MKRPKKALRIYVYRHRTAHNLKKVGERHDVREVLTVLLKFTLVREEMTRASSKEVGRELTA